MIIGMRGHDFGRMEPEALAPAIRETGFACTQLALSKAFAQKEDVYMVPERLLEIRHIFETEGLALPVMGCYISASDPDPAVHEAAIQKYCRCLEASKLLGTGCVGTETTHFSGSDSERRAAFARLLTFAERAAETAERCDAMAGIEPVALHVLNTPELARTLLDRIGSRHVGIILDLANLVTPDTLSESAQQDLLSRCLDAFADRVLALHVKDGVFEDGSWQNRPLGEGVMHWQTLLPRMAEAFPTLCAMREGVWPGLAKEECRRMHAWIQS